MNAPDHEHLIDLLVDGELDEPRRHKLLHQLDHQPDGWRRCALAFLEAQAWRQASRQQVARAEQPPPVAPTPSTPLQPARRAAPRWYQGRVGTLLATAASFFLALTVGLWWRGGLPFERPHLAGPPRVAPNTTVEGPTTRRDADSAWGNLTLVVDNGNGGPDTEIELPVVNVPQSTSDLLRQWPAALDAELRRALEREGHQVYQRRNWLPMQTEDGRRIVVPVDQVEIVPVGWQ